MSISDVILAAFAASPNLATVAVILPMVGYALTILAAMLPHPAAGSPWAAPRNALDWAAGNWGAARNAAPPARPGAVPPVALFLALVLTVAACTATQVATAQRVGLATCRVDGVAQPVLVALAGVSGYAQVAAVDVAVLHPLAVAACARVAGAFGVPASVESVTPTP